MYRFEDAMKQYLRAMAPQQAPQRERQGRSADTNDDTDDRDARDAGRAEGEREGDPDVD
jgi:hypothetical protein